MFTQTPYQASVNETFEPTHPRPMDGFITVACVDSISGNPAVGIAYSIPATSSPIPFTVDPTSGAFSVTDDLDFETDPTMYSFAVLCSYPEFPNSSALSNIEITVLPVNEFRPTVVGQSTFTITIDENAAVGTVIAATSGAGLVTYEVTDDDAGLDDSTITFTFTMENSITNLFSLNFTTGYLVLEQELDLDSGVVATFVTLPTITACDLIPAEDDCPNIQVSLLVSGVNEFSPEFSQDSYNASVLESAPEDFEVVVVSCTDADVGVGAFEGITIASTDQTVLDIFSIDSTTGSITLNRPVDFETDPQNFVFLVECNDTEGLQSSAMVYVTIEGVNDFFPTFSQPEYLVNVAESTPAGSLLEVALCTDGDVGVGVFSGIEIVSTDQETLNTFGVDSSSGNITLERELDFESIEQYEFMVRCFDSEGRETFSVVNVSVGDIFEVIQFSEVVYEASVNETFLPTSPRPADGFITVTCVNPNTSTPLTNATYNITTVSPLPFDIDFETGELVATEDLDFESGTTLYSFSVMCSLDIDDGSNVTTETDTALVEITILALNEFSPAFSQPTYNPSITESTNVSTTVVEATCTDGDVGVGALENIEIASTDQTILDTFAVDETSGNIYLQQPLDFESIQTYTFVIQCFDNVGTEANSNVTVNVLAVNEFPPQFSQDLYDASIPESTPTDSEVFVANCSDADIGTGALESIDIVSSDPAVLDIFTIDGTTGSVTLRRQVNFEVDPQTFTFMVQCNDTEGLLASAMAIIAIEGVNEVPPEFSQPTYEIDTPESTLIGTELEVAQCSDDDVGVGAFAGIEIVGNDQNILDTFALNGTSGSITLERELDFESTDRYSFMLRCFDNEGMESFSLVNVTVGNINDVLQFTEPVYEATVNETFIPDYPRPLDGFITVECVDPDPTIPVVDAIYNIAANFNLPFGINNETGALSVTEDLDFDTGNVFYTFDVVCTLNALPDVSDRTTIEITILAVNEFRPEIVGSSSILEPVLETAVVGTVFASTTNNSIITYEYEDADSGVADSNITFTFAEEDEDTSFFSLDLLTGNLTLVRELDFDNQTLGVYIIRTSITLCDIFPPVDTCPNLEIRFFVTAVNEFDPQFSQDTYESSILESLEVNSEVVVAECVDLDRSTGALSSIEIISTDQNVTDTFNIDSSTGSITLQQEVDFESVRSYEFTVVCRDVGFNDTAVVRVTIEDVNDNDPEPQPINDITLNDQTQTGTVITTAMCTDRDTVDSTITYALSDNLGLFEIATSSGEVNTTGALILDGNTFIQDYELTVMCADSGAAPRTGTTLINIQVYKNDVMPPSFTNLTFTTDVIENATVGLEVITIQANDIDSPELQYSLENENFPGLFAINSSTGAITIAQTLDRERASTYQADVVATEVRVAPGLAQSATAQLTINIQDINDNPPRCDSTLSQLTATITAGNHDSTSLSVTFSCNDADGGDNSVLRYTLIESTLPALDRGSFVINEATGQLTLEGTIRAGTYSFSVRVSDSGQSPQSVVLEINLIVSPAADESSVVVIVVPIVVIVFGLLFIIILAILIVAVLRRRRKHKGAKIR